jgi:hypothetical protein
VGYIGKFSVTLQAGTKGHPPQLKTSVTLRRTWKTQNADLTRIASEGKMGALLLQFPISYRYNEGNWDRLIDILDLFRDYPMAVEVRHLCSGRDYVARRCCVRDGRRTDALLRPIIARHGPCAHARGVLRISTQYSSRTSSPISTGRFKFISITG